MYLPQEVSGRKDTRFQLNMGKSKNYAGERGEELTKYHMIIEMTDCTVIYPGLLFLWA